MSGVGMTTNSGDGEQTASATINFTAFPLEHAHSFLNGTLTTTAADATAQPYIDEKYEQGTVTGFSIAPAASGVLRNGVYLATYNGTGFDITSMIEFSLSAVKTGLTEAEIGIAITAGSGNTVGDYYVISVIPANAGVNTVNVGAARGQGYFSIVVMPDLSHATNAGQQYEVLHIPQCILEGERGLNNARGENQALEATFKVLQSAEAENGYFILKWATRA